MPLLVGNLIEMEKFENENNAIFCIKASCQFRVKIWQQMLGGENNCGDGICSALKYKSRAKRWVYSLGGNDRDRKGSLRKNEKKSHFPAIISQIVVKL